MRSITAFSLGVFVSGLVVVGVLHAPSAESDDCVPGQPAGKAAGGAAGGAAAPAGDAKSGGDQPRKEAAIEHAFLTSMVGDWTCDCSYPTGGHATGTATAKLVLDGTALMTETVMEWQVGEGKSETIHNIGLAKLGTDGKSLTYWVFSSHDNTVDQLTGTFTDDGATVSGMTRWGPMRISLGMTDGNLTQQLWINHKDMGKVTFTKK
jgi:hypothetical protein